MGQNPAQTLLSRTRWVGLPRKYILSGLNKGIIWANSSSEANQRNVTRVLRKPYLKLPLSSDSLRYMHQLIPFIVLAICFLLLVTKNIKVNSLCNTKVTETSLSVQNTPSEIIYSITHYSSCWRQAKGTASCLASWNIPVPCKLLCFGRISLLPLIELL